MEDKKTLTLRELQALADAEAGKKGLECRACGCRDFRTYYTRRRDHSIFRVKVCRNCGVRKMTTETEA